MSPKTRMAPARGQLAWAWAPVVPLVASEKAEPLVPNCAVLSPSARDHAVAEQESEPWEQIVNLDDWADFKARHHLEVVSIEWPAWAVSPVVTVRVKQ
jgi:hypothetical protein